MPCRKHIITSIEKPCSYGYRLKSEWDNLRGERAKTSGLSPPPLDSASYLSVMRRPCFLLIIAMLVQAVWSNIDSHLIMYTFLPALIYASSVSMNVHVFVKSSMQVSFTH